MCCIGFWPLRVNLPLVTFFLIHVVFVRINAVNERWNIYRAIKASDLILITASSTSQEKTFFWKTFNKMDGFILLWCLDHLIHLQVNNWFHFYRLRIPLCIGSFHFDMAIVTSVSSNYCHCQNMLCHNSKRANVLIFKQEIYLTKEKNKRASKKCLSSLSIHLVQCQDLRETIVVA